MHTLWRDTHVGDTIIGIKGRVGFEAAAPLIIIKAHHLLEKHTLENGNNIGKSNSEIGTECYFMKGNFLIL
jgi:argininosuccinate synthase